MGEMPSAAKGIYSIAIASELSGVGEQALRLYERKGLLTPERTPGGTRRYSHNDVVALRRVVVLLSEGLNLVGARRVMELEAINEALRARNSRRGDRG